MANDGLFLFRLSDIADSKVNMSMLLRLLSKVEDNKKHILKMKSLNRLSNHLHAFSHEVDYRNKLRLYLRKLFTYTST